MTLQFIVNEPFVDLLTMGKKNAKIRQPHKEEKWKYKNKENKNVPRIQYDYPALVTEFNILGKTFC